MNQSRNSNLLARVQSRVDKTYVERTENYTKNVLEGKNELEKPERKITKFFTRG